MSKPAKYRPELPGNITLSEYREWLYARAALYEREALRIRNLRIRHVHRLLAESRRSLANLLGAHGADSITDDHVLRCEEAWAMILGLPAPFKRGPLSDVRRFAEPPESSVDD